MKLEPLLKEAYYHIYNRGIDGTSIFRNDENKRYFLKLAKKYLEGKVSFLAYCLMDNHYHMLVRIEEDEKVVSQSFSNLFNAYAKAFNKRFGRTGSLFEKHFRRIRIKDEAYLKNLIIYIHINPEQHGVVSDFTKFHFSSYPHFFSELDVEAPEIEIKEVLELFDNVEDMAQVHRVKIGRDDDLLDLQGGAPKGGQHLAGQHDEKSVDLQGMSEERAILVGLKRATPSGPEESPIKDNFYDYIQTLQDTITSKLEEVDGEAKFQEDIWERPEGGGGRTRVIENANVFEKGGVNISAVHGALPQSMQTYFGVKDADFFACGLSLVLHPKNPMVPTVHANWRYFEMYNKKGEIVDQWFGGGQDLTPYYLFDEDAVHFHSICKKACDAHHADFYSRYKKKCDDYFWNAHRNEARGIGGLFFDYCKASEEMTMQDWYGFVTEVGNSFLDSYIPIVIKRRGLDYSPEQRDWQEIRRGRYVEFNLVHDKGTLFGLKTNGRIESILMSLPPHVQWKYDHHPKKGSEEARLIEILKHPKEWV